MLVRIWGNRNSCTLLVGLQISAAAMLWRFLRKLGMDPPYDPPIPLLGIFPKGLKSENYSNMCISMFIAAQFTIA